MQTTQQQQQQQMPMIVSATTTAKPATPHTAAAHTAAAVVFGTVKDSRWLTLEVCREFARNKCIRSDEECRFAHPTSNVEVQNGRVMCCFDSIKGRCQRSDPPCKYLHPPQHLKEQLLQNGRNNLMWRNFQMQQLSGGIHQFVPTMFPVVHQGPSAPPPSHPLPPLPPSASYLISTNTAPHPHPPVTYYHSPLPSSTTTNESPLVSMTTVAMMTRSMTSQPATHCNIVQSDVAESVPDTSATCLPNNGGGCQNQYWLNQQPSAFFDSSSACANYYSPPTAAAVFYQGLNQLVPVAKTHLIPADLRNGNVTVFPCGSSVSSYQQMTLPSVFTGGGVGVAGGVGGQQQPCYGRLAVPGTMPVMQRY